MKGLISGLIAGLLLATLSFAPGVAFQGSTRAAPSGWDALPDLLHPAGDGAAFILGDTLYYAGGWNGAPDQPLNAVQALSLSGVGAWSDTGLPLSPGRFGAASVVVGGRAYLIGGYAGAILDRVDSFDGSAWRQENSTGLGALNFPAAEALHGRIYVAGGLPGPVNSVRSADVNADGTLGAWRSEAALPRGLITQMATVNQCLYAIGGKDSSGSRRSEIYRAAWANDSIVGWEAVGTLPVPLALHTVAIDQDVLYVLGGETANGVLNGSVYSIGVDPDTCALAGAWETSPLPGGGNRRLTAAGRFGELYLLGGETSGGFSAAAWKGTLPTPPAEMTLQKAAAWEGDFGYGTLITYTVTYANPWAHPSGQQGVLITDTLPAHTTFVSATLGVTPTGGMLRWEIGDVAHGAGGTISFTARVDVPDLDWALSNAISLTGHVTQEQNSTLLLDPSIEYTLVYTPTGAERTPEGILITTTLPAQLLPTAITGTSSSAVEFAYREAESLLLVRIPGPITQTGRITISNCISETFVPSESAPIPAGLTDVLGQIRVAETTFAQAEYMVPATCSPTDTLLLKAYAESVAPITPEVVIRNRAWICSDNLTACRSSNETVTRYWPYRIYLPLIERSGP